MVMRSLVALKYEKDSYTSSGEEIYCLFNETGPELS